MIYVRMRRVESEHNIIYYFGLKLKTCFADMLMFIVAKIKKIDTLKRNKVY